MRAFNVKAKNLESAQALFDSLRQFDPALQGDPAEGYSVAIDVGASDRRLLDVLDAIQEHVRARDATAKVELDGRDYTICPPEWK
jgi:hypothetical protein